MFLLPFKRQAVIAAEYTGTGTRSTVREYAVGKEEEEMGKKRIDEEYIIVSSRVALPVVQNRLRHEPL